MLFQKEINGWEDWSKVYDKIEDFRLLINSIFSNENINITGNIQNLTPGSNAVFRIDDYVIKIFAPIESRFIGNL